MRPLSLLLVVAIIALAGCGSSSSSSSSSSATKSASGSAVTSTAKFALHAGLAFGAFHRYIYKPLKSGELKSPLLHKLTLVKAVAAGAFTVHEIKLASEAAKGSPTLSKLVAPLSAVSAGIGTAVASAKSGHVDTNALESSNSTIDSIKSEASKGGASVPETSPSVP
jgi:asparagine N-glycosylation enzyme membrane subunit Stt3